MRRAKWVVFVASFVLSCGVACAELEFSQISTLPDGYWLHATVISSGNYYLLGGISQYNGVYDGDKVFVASVTSPGSLGSWTQTESLPALIFFHTAVAVSSRVYVIGGQHYDVEESIWHQSSAVYFSSVQPNGLLGAWTQTTDLPTPLYAHATVVRNGVIFVTGGWDDNVGGRTETYAGHIAANGSISTWTAITPLPNLLYGHSSVASSSALYVIGGVVDPGGISTDVVRYAQFQSSVTIGTWQEATALPVRLVSHTSQIVSDQIWNVAGTIPNDPWATANSHYAQIENNDSLGAWSSGPDLSVAVWYQSSALADDVLYVAGGIDTNYNLRNEVWALLDSGNRSSVEAAQMVTSGDKRVSMAHGTSQADRAPEVSLVSENRQTSIARQDARLVIPRGSARGNFPVMIAATSRNTSEDVKRRAASALLHSLVPVSEEITCFPGFARFSKPASLHLAYSRAALPTGAPEAGLAIYRWDPRLGQWVALQSQVDVSEQAVSADIIEFTTFRIFLSHEAAPRPAPLGYPIPQWRRNSGRHSRPRQN